jgi:hypothetical protein
LLKEPLNASRSYDPVFLLCLGSCWMGSRASTWDTLGDVKSDMYVVV